MGSARGGVKAGTAHGGVKAESATMAAGVSAVAGMLAGGAAVVGVAAYGRRRRQGVLPERATPAPVMSC